MNKINKVIVSLTVLALTAFSVAAQSNTESLYNREFSVFASSGFQLGNKYQANATVGAQAFLNEYLGLTLAAPVYKGDGSTIESLSLGPVIRVPIKNFAPYLGLSTTYDWNKDNFSYLGRAGCELRFTKSWGVFAEYDYAVQYLNSKNSIQGGLGNIQIGISLVF